MRVGEILDFTKEKPFSSWHKLLDEKRTKAGIERILADDEAVKVREGRGGGGGGGGGGGWGREGGREGGWVGGREGEWELGRERGRKGGGGWVGVGVGRG